MSEFSRQTHPILNQAGRDWYHGLNKRKSHFPPKENDMDTRTLSSFVAARLHDYANSDCCDSYGELMAAWSRAHDQIDVTRSPHGPKEYLPGEVKDEQALRVMARMWREHPDYRREWA